ncbi:hypothetical protein Sps_01466 [Shewanella psychrophila]|uniref:Uncharacterized protein n=1 Tax=Shewanella psychrophila TaxID=225848 RepID=A0A1S6HM94_9GAMM|nr:hypothetical protein [Shewanella psychrophila]AQS36632.1 hypothetical protein Sps_01466 [Shewanella psychrophila]
MLLNELFVGTYWIGAFTEFFITAIDKSALIFSVIVSTLYSLSITELSELSGVVIGGGAFIVSWWYKHHKLSLLKSKLRENQPLEDIFEEEER